MMLRSSSTPILSSLISSYPESPNHNHHSEFNSSKHLPKRLSLHHTQAGHLHVITPSAYSFNSSPCVNAECGSDERQSSQTGGFRRAQSEGNLEGLLSDSCNSFDEFSHAAATKKFPRKPSCAVLQTIPSFSVYNPNRKYEDKEEEEEESDEEFEERVMVETANQQMQIKVDNEDLSKAFLSNMRLQERDGFVKVQMDNIPSKMHLAKGLGVMTGGYNGGDGGHKERKSKGPGGDGGDEASIEQYYKRMVEENPANPLFLRNSAQFLHQSKDFGRAEEYDSRAILVDPGDGEILSQYAQLTWELHGDEERASSYFERAVQASPEDSSVLAAYAGFLWDTEEDGDDLCTVPPVIHENVIATFSNLGF